MSETLDDLIPYVICLLPCPLLVWCWRRLQPEWLTLRSVARRTLIMVSLLLGTASCVLLAIFPAILHRLELTRSTLADGWYVASVRVGFWAACGCVAVSPFALGRLRVPLVTSGILLVAIWFLVGVAH